MQMTVFELLARSRATHEFKADVRAYDAHQPAPRVTASRHAPRVKVLRVIAQLLDAYADLAVERVHIEAISGCSDFRGTLTVEAEGERRVFDFVWDCHWRAVQQGWTDAFGLPDQIRAAHVFGYQCFEQWHERPSERAAAPVRRAS